MGEETASEGEEGEEGEANIAQRSPLKKKIEAFFNHSVSSAVMMTATFYALFGLDLVAWFQIPSDYDLIIDIVSAIALILFFLEFGLKTYAEAGYTWSFFFWLDFIAAVSLIPDVPWIWLPIKNYLGWGVGG